LQQNFNLNPKRIMNSKRFFTYFLMLSLLGAGLWSCSDDDDTDPTPDPGSLFPDGITSSEVTISGTTYTQIVGTFDGDFTLSNDNPWLISGGIFVEDGVTLTIEEGTQIFAADDGSTAFLSILRGGKIQALGTASQPIVMTTIKTITGGAAPGDWGGIIVNGFGDINTGDTAEGEGDTGTYGGNNDSDNSGRISYVRLEYTGKILGTDNELNGFSFNGVGSATQIDHIQAYFGKDDGIEFFGGTARVKYAVSTGSNDDSFDWTHGWRGKGQFWVVEQSPAAGDRGFEADNNSDNNAAAPFSQPQISNVTLVGADDGDGSNTGMRLREGTKGNIHNAIVTGFPSRGVRVSDDQTVANMNDGSLVFANSVVFGNGTDFQADVFANSPSNTIANPGLNGVIGIVTNGNEVDPSTALDSWFESVNFIGAVDPANNWLSGWAKKADGSVF
jgi:hypothetical protein